MKTIFIDTFQYSSYLVQCISVDGESWLRGDHVATILGYTNTTEALNELDDDDVKTLGELLASSNTDLFISVYGLLCLVHACKKPDAHVFRRWVWSDIIRVIQRSIPPDHCSYDDDDVIDGDDEDDVESKWSVDATQGKG